MYSQMPGNPMQGPGPYQQSGYGPDQQGGYQAQPFYGPESDYGPRPSPRQDWSVGASPEQDIADLALGAASRFIGRAIRNRMQRVVEQRVVPTLNARAEQSRQEMQAIAERYPELRACLHDQVIFLAGGTRTVPLSEVSPNNITLAQADAIVTRLREP